MKKLWHTVEHLLGVYRWHPTIALRYLPIVDAIKEKGLLDTHIIEVGSGGLGITPYIDRKVVGVDVDFSPPIHPKLVPVKGSVLELPFSENSYDVVVSTDMLEHVSGKDRLKAISELLRVTGKFLCIGVPCGALANQQDEKLANLYKRTHKHEFNFFAEHAQFGLPTKEEIQAAIYKAAGASHKKIHLSSRGTLNLELRYFLMRGWISTNPIINLFFRKLLLPAIPILRMINREPTYRELFFVSILT